MVPPYKKTTSPGPSTGEIILWFLLIGVGLITLFKILKSVVHLNRKHRNNNQNNKNIVKFNVNVRHDPGEQTISFNKKRGL